MIPRLFIGGPADGRRISLPEGESLYRIPVEPSSSVSFEFEQEIVVKNYRREILRGLDKHGKPVDHEVFVEQSVTPAQMIGELISKYPDSDRAMISVPLGMAETLSDLMPFDATKKQRDALRGLMALIHQYLEERGA